MSCRRGTSPALSSQSLQISMPGGVSFMNVYMKFLLPATSENCSSLLFHVHPQCAMDTQGVHSPWQESRTSGGHGGDMAGWWYWCLSACLSRKFPVCAAQVYLPGGSWAHIKSISGEKPQAGYLYFVKISLSSSVADCFTTQVPLLKTTPKLTPRCCGESGIFNN